MNNSNAVDDESSSLTSPGEEVTDLLHRNRFSKALHLTKDALILSSFDMAQVFLNTICRYSVANSLKMGHVLVSRGMDIHYQYDNSGPFPGADVFHCFIHDFRDSDAKAFGEKAKVFEILGLNFKTHDPAFLLNFAISCSNFGAVEWLLSQKTDLDFETPSPLWDTHYLTVMEEAADDDDKWNALIFQLKSDKEKESLEKKLDHPLQESFSKLRL